MMTLRLRNISSLLAHFFGILILSSSQAFAQNKSIDFPWGDGFLHVQKNNQVLFHRPFGKTRVEANEPFPIASISKQMTAYLIYKLINEGLLTENTLVSDVLPLIPKGSATVRDLLEHTAGINDYIENQTSSESLGNFNCEQPEAFNSMARNSSYEYSNKGYCLLAKMIEAKLKVPFDQAMDERVFSPLQMRETKAAKMSDEFSELVGFTEGVGSVFALPENFFGSAGVVTTANDLVKWKALLKDPQFLPVTFLAEIKSKIKNDPNRRSVYRRGLYFDVSHGELVISHTGKIEGHNAYLAYFPENDLYVFILLDRFLQSEIAYSAPAFVDRLKKQFPELK